MLWPKGGKAPAKVRTTASGQRRALPLNWACWAHAWSRSRSSPPPRRATSGLWIPRPGSCGRGGSAGREAGEQWSWGAFRPAPFCQAAELSVMALPSRLWRLLPLRRGATQSFRQLARTWGSRGYCGSEVTRCPGPALSFGRESRVVLHPGWTSGELVCVLPALPVRK